MGLVGVEWAIIGYEFRALWLSFLFLSCTVLFTAYCISQMGHEPHFSMSLTSVAFHSSSSITRGSKAIIFIDQSP